MNILITGASRGLGYELTKKYLEDGHVVFAGTRNMDDNLLLNLVKEYNSRLHIIKLAVDNQNSIDESYEIVKQYSECIDTVINNAAIHSESSFNILEETNLEECLDVYDVNSIGPLRVVKTFIGLLRKSSNGRVINISSESGSISTCRREKEFDYCMSKAALNMGTVLLSNYLKKDNIKVVSIHPGWMRTDMGGKHAHLDPYETAVKLVGLFESMVGDDYSRFIDNEGIEYPF